MHVIQSEQRLVRVPIEDFALEGNLSIPENAQGVVVTGVPAT